jgi:hypothetical protein
MWIISVLLSIPILTLNVEAAHSQGSKPVLNMDCGQLTGDYDENGSFALFNPTVTARYFGLPFKVTAYYSDQPNTSLKDSSKRIVTVEGRASASKFFKSDLDFSHKFLEFGKKQTGYYKVYFVAVDSLGRKSRYACLYRDYYFTFPSSGGFNSPKGGGSFSRGFNRTNCSFDGKKLYGRIYFTRNSYDADIKAYVTSYSFDADLKVYLTEYSFDARSCGRWYPTEYSFDADLKVYLTSSSFDSDIKIYQTEYSFDAGAR